MSDTNNYGKTKYELKKKKADEKRRRIDTSMKEITFSIRTSANDLLIKRRMHDAL